LQVTGVPVQVPPWQLSPVVHMLLSLQLVPFVTGVVPHAPVVVLQVGVWQVAPGHVFIVPGTHAPPWQASPIVHALLSVQLVPFVMGVVPHAPEVVSQVAVWHAGAAGHVFIVPGTHAPLWQVSPTVHALLSVQLVPFPMGVVPHVPDVVSQVGFWQAPAGHDFIEPGAQDPF
jgi:hypothetical protein